MTDDFARAHELARSKYPGSHWDSLPTAEQARAIYLALRQIDAKRLADDRRPSDFGASGCAGPASDPAGSIEPVPEVEELPPASASGGY